VLDRGDLAGAEPSLSEGVLGAVYCPDDGVVDQTATTIAYAHAARALGADVREGFAVARCEAAAGRVTAIIDAAGGRTEAARAVLLLVNAQATPLLASVGAQIDLPRVYPQVVIARPPADVALRHLVGHMERRLAMKRLPSGEIMVSGGWLGRWNEAEERGEVIDANVAANLQDAAAVVPALAGATVASAHADLAEAVGPGLLPVIDRAPECENLYLGTGWTGHGFAIAPAAARLLARWALGSAKPVEFLPFGWREAGS
jgi:sarcosine oxidase subunit beta